MHFTKESEYLAYRNSSHRPSSETLDGSFSSTLGNTLMACSSLPRAFSKRDTNAGNNLMEFLNSVHADEPQTVKVVSKGVCYFFYTRIQKLTNHNGRTQEKGPPCTEGAIFQSFVQAEDCLPARWPLLLNF